MRCAPELPDAIRALANAQNDGAVVLCVGEWDRIVGVGAEPRIAAVEASANVGAIVVSHYVFAIYAARELDAVNFDLRVLVTRDAIVGDGDSPPRKSVAKNLTLCY